jgi:ribose 5-phosphate isomerase B
VSPLPDEDIHNIVDRVVRQTLGYLSSSAQSNSIPQTTDMPSAKSTPSSQRIAIGSDHGGYELKEILKTELVGQGYEIIDCGTNSKEAVDYPDFALAVAQKVSQGNVWRGIVIDGAGIGSCMAANKVPGVRAAMCYDYASASNSREHNDANVLTLGAGLIGTNQAKLIVKTWLTTEFGGGRHQKRVDKIISIEKQFLKDGK